MAGSRGLGLAIAVLLLATAACVAPAPEHGRGCPCLPGYRCCANRCIAMGEDCPSSGSLIGASCDASVDGSASVLIDDMEDGTTSLGRDAGSYGWYTFNDHTGGMQSLATEKLTPPRCSSHYALHVSASGFSGWGTGIAFDLDPIAEPDGGFTHRGFDASNYAGVRFWAKSGGNDPPTATIDAGDGTVGVRIVVNDVSTDPLGGICSADVDASDACYKPFQAETVITPSWTEKVISFDELKQIASWNGLQAEGGLTRTSFYSLGLDFPTMSAETHVDVWIDDIAWVVKR